MLDLVRVRGNIFTFQTIKINIFTKTASLLENKFLLTKSQLTISLKKKKQLKNSSHWQSFCKKAICRVPHRKHTKGNGKILVAGKRLNLGVRGPGEKPSWGETRSSDTGGSHPGQES